MLRKILAVLFAALLLGAFAGCSSDDSGSDDATEESSTTESTAEEESADDEEAMDDEELAEPEAQALVDKLQSSGSFGEIDDEVALCTAEGVLADDDLADLVTTDADIDPTSPEFATLLDIVLGCDGRDFLQAAFEEGMAGSGTEAQVSCISDYISDLSDDEFSEFVLGAAAEDESVLEPIMECMLAE